MPFSRRSISCRRLPTSAVSKFPHDRVIDGVDQTDLLLGKSESRQPRHYFYHSGSHGVRQGKWKLLHANRWSEIGNASGALTPRISVPTKSNSTTSMKTSPKRPTWREQHPEIVAQLSRIGFAARKAHGTAGWHAIQEERQALTQDKAKSTRRAHRIDDVTPPLADKLLPAPANRFVHYGSRAARLRLRHDPVLARRRLSSVLSQRGLDDEGKKTGIKWSHAKNGGLSFIGRRCPTRFLPGELDPNCWTGSLIEKDGTFYLFYTGKSLPDQPDPKGDQKIMLATSTDLVHFEKQPDFTFYADGEIYWNKHDQWSARPEACRSTTNATSRFATPKCSGIRNTMNTGCSCTPARRRSQRHCFGVYRSDDLLAWTPAEPLEITVPVHQSNIDCPDLFQLGGKWVLTFSGGPRYAIADKSEGPYGNHRPADHNLFVPKTTRDDQGRVLVAGTVRPDKGVIGGRGSMVREYYLANDGRLLQRPLPEVVAAFSESVGTLDASGQERGHRPGETYR